jgi:hypothetical protein
MPPNRPHARLFSRILDPFVAETLMVAFAMIVRHEFGERTPEVALTQPDRTVRHFSSIERTSRSAYALQFGCAPQKHESEQNRRLRPTLVLRKNTESE